MSLNSHWVFLLFGLLLGQHYVSSYGDVPDPNLSFYISNLKTADTAMVLFNNDYSTGCGKSGYEGLKDDCKSKEKAGYSFHYCLCMLGVSIVTNSFSKYTLFCLL